METNKATVRVFGRDCLGNVTGFAVVSRTGTVLAQYVADLYTEGSLTEARRRAENDVRDLNWTATEGIAAVRRDLAEEA